MAYVCKLGGKDREFPLLTAGDLRELCAQIPSTSIIDISALDLWAKNPVGCLSFLVASARKTNPGITADEVAGWGSILSRCNAASGLFLASITDGEPDPNVPGGKTAPPPPQ